MNKEWFEMRDIRRRNFGKAVWIPLRAVYCHERTGKFGFDGYKEDFFGTGSIAVPTHQQEAVKKLGWMEIGIGHDHSGWVEDGMYTSADSYKDYDGEIGGLHFVLSQRSLDGEPRVWHLHQDLVQTLGLRREGNVWLCPDDGYSEVARIKYNDDGNPNMLEIKAQYLKDYLCARGMGLYMTSYFSRDFITDDPTFLNWESEHVSDNSESERWEGRVISIHEGGHPFGEKMAVFHVARTDVEESDDVPDISGIPTDENTRGDSWERKFEGKKLYRVLGELWRNEWIEPGKQSPKVRGDKTAPTVFFTIDAEGTKVCGEELIDSGKWLWFKPDVVMALAHRRCGSLSFYTRDTGSVSCSYGSGVHFGVNDLGYVNVYAKDVGVLPEWQQQIWAGYNIPPDGGVSRELLASQVRAEPANTQAPEAFLEKAIDMINSLSRDKIGTTLFREHEIIPELLMKIHRFRAIDQASLFALAKDLARLTADSLDAGAMQTIVSPPKGTKWGSLKSLENLLASKFDRELVRKVLAPLVGVYELRHADAHLPSNEIDDAFQLIEVDRSLPFVHQGHMMLHKVVSSLYGVAETLKSWK